MHVPAGTGFGWHALRFLAGLPPPACPIKWPMKKPKNSPAPPRPLYALLLVATALLLWLLAQPRPGLRVVRLKPVLAPETGTPAPVVPERIRIATYNLENFTDGRNDEPERTPEVFMTHARGAAAIIAEADPDILMLEEIENGRVLEYLNDQFEKPYAYIYISKLRHSSGENEKLNLALLSRFRPRNVRQLGFYNLAGAGRPTRGSLAAEFDLGADSRLLVYGIHLKSNFGDAPHNQAQRAIALHHIAADAVAVNLQNNPSPTFTVILGDTNVDPDSEAFAADPSLDPLSGSYVDLWRGRPIEERTTIPTRQAGETGDPLLVFPPSAFDRVFVSRNLAANGPWNALPPQTLQKGTDTNNNLTPPGFNGHVSDHHLVYVDLTR
jgi:endonuclease/exonuclease/phosphatase family metal-dependent hydrolase